MTIKNLMMEYDVILASASPRRKELMQLICPGFRVIPADCGEAVPEALSSRDVPGFLSYQKCECIAQVYQNSVVIGCDTVVVLEDQIMGKPKDREDAFRMLRQLSGETHTVMTGVALYRGTQTSVFTSETEVTFYTLSDEEIHAYLDTGEPFDKAGAYGIQGKGSLLVREIRGDYFNVVGLPVAALSRAITQFERLTAKPRIHLKKP